jgi:predicted negative regulator of RcsB-dependent stress response
MAYDHEEQEQLASLKAFWSRYGNLVTWTLIIALGAYAGYNFWNTHQRGKSVEASALYDELLVSVQANDNAKVQRIATDVESKYGRTAYAQMSALGAAKAAFEANDLKTAKSRLQWVIDNGNDEYKSIARLRMSGLLLDEKAYDQALKTLDADIMPEYAAEAADRRGDVLVAQNKLAEARAAYQKALVGMDKKNPGRQLVQLKLDAIGGGTAPAPAAAAASKAAA